MTSIMVQTVDEIIADFIDQFGISSVGEGRDRDGDPAIIVVNGSADLPETYRGLTVIKVSSPPARV